MADKAQVFDVSLLGINPARGGVAQIVSGTLLRHSEMTDKETGEVTLMAEIEFRGGTHFQVYKPGDAIHRVPEDSDILMSCRQKKGKKGWYSTGTIALLAVNGEGVAA